jgi:hypothetical protein
MTGNNLLCSKGKLHLSVQLRIVLKVHGPRRLLGPLSHAQLDLAALRLEVVDAAGHELKVDVLQSFDQRHGEAPLG